MNTSVRTEESSQLQSPLQSAVYPAHSWVIGNKLELNAKKTKVL